MGDLDDQLHKWMQYRTDKDRHVGQMKDALDRKRDQIDMLGKTNADNLQRAMDRKAQRIKEMMEMRSRVEQERVDGRQVADDMKQRFDMQKVKDGIATVGNLVSNLGDPAGYVSKKIDQNKEFTQKRQNTWATGSGGHLFNDYENMKVSEEAFEGLKNIAKQYNVRWQPTEDGEGIIATLPDYELEDHDVFAFIANGQILDEVEIPITRWEMLNDLFKNRLFIDGSLDHLDFVEKILYKVLPKKNHIKKFITTEEHFMKVYNKMVELEA